MVKLIIQKKYTTPSKNKANKQKTTQLKTPGSETTKSSFFW
jgi:hypothetical protein